MRAKVTRLAGVAALVVGLSFGLPAGALGASAPTPLVTGTLSDGGRPVADTDVWLMAEAPNDVVAAAPIGASFADDVLGRTRTDSRGHYSFPDSALLHLTDASSGLANLHLQATTPSGLASQYFSRDIVLRGGALQSLVEVSSGASTTARTVNLPVNFPLPRASVRAMASVSPAVGCTRWTKQSQDDLIPVVVGQAFLLSGDVGTNTTWRSSSSSSLGVGLSIAGGAFKLDGTSTVSDSLATDSRVLAHGERAFWMSRYSYVWEEQYCPLTIFKRYRPIKHNGGLSEKATAVPVLTKCVPYEKGSRVTRTSGRAHNYSGGVSSGGTIGINLSAQTGYSSDAALTYFSNYSRGFTVCGENDYPGGTGNVGMIEARANYPKGCGVAPVVATLRPSIPC